MVSFLAGCRGVCVNVTLELWGVVWLGRVVKSPLLDLSSALSGGTEVVPSISKPMTSVNSVLL